MRREALFMNNLAQLVLDDFNEKIRKNEIIPGARIVEQQIAHELKISRTPVREALFRLEQEGLLETIENVGTFVRNISIEDIIEIYEIRAILEGLAARLLVRSGNNTHLIDKLEIIADEYDRLFEKEARVDVLEALDIKFHNLIIDNCGSRELKKKIQNGFPLVSIFKQRKRVITVSQLLQTGKEKYGHKKIITAIKSKKEYLAEKNMRKHVIEGKNKLLAIYLRKI